MIYRPVNGAMWDPSLIWFDGKYHAFMMYSRDTANGFDAGHCLKAVSDDGVHWRDDTVVIEEPERQKGWKFFKCFVVRCGDRFIMNHGVARPEGQDLMRFYESKDLKTWNLISSTRPDPRWYGLPPDPHRWDHMYILPKEEGNPAAGYWGYPVAVAKPGEPCGVGMMHSPDGRTWEVLPPARVEWGDIPPANLEWGGCERFAGKFYLIGGGVHMGFKAYGMFVFQADAPTGPFRPDPETVRLCGNSHVRISWLAAWCRGNGELLISNYASMEPGNLAPWLLPLRQPIADENGHLHLAWWKGNEALKGPRLPFDVTSATVDAAQNAFQTVALPLHFDENKGIVIEGRIRAHAAGPEAAAGLALAESGDACMAVLLGIGKPGARETRIGRLKGGGTASFEVMDVTGTHSATVTGIEDGREHRFRLLSRIGLFELYIDDRLMQTFFYKPGEGRLRLVARSARAEFSDLRAWTVSL